MHWLKYLLSDLEFYDHINTLALTEMVRANLSAKQTLSFGQAHQWKIGVTIRDIG